jgi:hypothetical protein
MQRASVLDHLPFLPRILAVGTSFATIQIARNQYQTRCQRKKKRCNNFVPYLTETDGSTYVTDSAIFLTCRWGLLISGKVSDAAPIRVHEVVPPGKYELPAKHGCVISETATVVTDRSDGA